MASVGLWNFACRAARFLMERRAFALKTCMSHSEYPMNIFYIIGVAGFFGLHV
jgi:hypothetical protein